MLTVDTYMQYIDELKLNWNWIFYKLDGLINHKKCIYHNR